MRKTKKISLVGLCALLLASCNVQPDSPTSPSSPSGTSTPVQSTPNSGSGNQSSPNNSTGDPAVQKVTLTLNPNGGLVDGLADPVVTEHDEGATVTLPTPTWANADSVFDGWYNGGTKIDGLTFTVNQTTTLEARWIRQTFTVTLDPLANGTVETTTANVRTGQDYTLPVPTRAGYTFTGWTYQGTALTDATGQSLQAWNLTQDVTLEAGYTTIPYTINLYFTKANLLASKDYHIEMDLSDVLEHDLAALTAPVLGYYKDDTYTQLVKSFADLTINADNTINVYANRASGYTVSQNSELSGTPANLGAEYDLSHLFLKGRRIQTIKASAFSGNTTLQKIYIPNSVQSIENGALSSLTGLTEINVEVAEADKPAGWLDTWDTTKVTVNWGVKN